MADSQSTPQATPPPKAAGQSSLDPTLEIVPDVGCPLISRLCRF